MKTSFAQAQPLVRRFTEWVATLDSRPREKQLAIGTGIVAGLFAWFAIALGSPLLLAAVPLLGGLLYGGVQAQRRLQPVEGPVEVSLDRVTPRATAATAPVATAPSVAAHVEPPVAVYEEADDEPEEESLLSRLSLAPPPPPVGRSTAAYVYEPEPDPEPVVEEEYDDDDDDEESLDLRDRYYEVCETVAGRSLVRHTSPSLFGATDFALELHTSARDTELEVVRIRGEQRESVLRFSRDRPPEGAESAKSLLDLFGYPVTRWKGPTG